MKKIGYLLVASLLFLLIGCSGTTTNVTTTLDEEETTTVEQVATTDEVTTEATSEGHKTTETGTTQVNTYTIQWVVDGNIIEVDNDVVEGTMPSYDGNTPERDSTNVYDYAFVGWSPALEEVTGDVTYIAQFEETYNQYEVSFYSFGTEEIPDQFVNYEGQIEAPDEPVREGFIFQGWFLDEALTMAVEFPLTITEDITLYSMWTEQVPYVDYLLTIFSSYRVDPYDLIPSTMDMGDAMIDMTPTQVDAIDYSNFTDTTSIPYGGHGEQWHMVIDNINQTKNFLNVLDTVDALATASVAAFNNYIDSNPSDKATYEFIDGIYNVSIKYEVDTLYYVLDYTKDLPFFGEQTVQIALSLNVLTGERNGRIQVGDANALRYVINGDTFQFAIKYAGIRRAYFEIITDGDDVHGHIHEYLGVDGVYSLGSAAEFHTEADYLFVIGNKSSSMTGWEGTIMEYYLLDTGEMLGYEIEETLSAITYNTFWFNLDDTTGITNVKFLDAPIEDANPYLVYVNNQTEVFETKTYGGITPKTLSRRFDIELRTQYFYHFDGQDILEYEIEVPMIFVQMEKADDFVIDVNEVNPSLSFTFDSTADFYRQMMHHYFSQNLESFEENKDNFTVESIIEYIGDPIVHE